MDVRSSEWKKKIVWGLVPALLLGVWLWDPGRRISGVLDALERDFFAVPASRKIATGGVPLSSALTTGLVVDDRKPDRARRVDSGSEAGDWIDLSIILGDHGAAGGTCGALEYRGSASSQLSLRKKDWLQVMRLFRLAKDRLQSWLISHRGRMDAMTYEILFRRLMKAEIDPAPHEAHPDLSWRGIGIWSLAEGDQPRIKLGGGFVPMALARPKRAEFELVRLLVQSWSPCELLRMSVRNIWADLVACFGIENHQEEECRIGAYSESGWAVSTVLAARLTKPGCRIPALEDAKIQACVGAAIP